MKLYVGARNNSQTVANTPEQYFPGSGTYYQYTVVFAAGTSAAACARVEARLLTALTSLGRI